MNRSLLFVLCYTTQDQFFECHSEAGQVFIGDQPDSQTFFRFSGLYFLHILQELKDINLNRQSSLNGITAFFSGIRRTVTHPPVFVLAQKIGFAMFNFQLFVIQQWDHLSNIGKKQKK